MIGRKTTLALANMVLGSVLGIVALFLIGRYFGPEANGQAYFAYSALGLLFFITDLGMGQAHVKRVSEGRHAGDCFATYAVFKLVMTGAFLLLAAAALAFSVLVLGRTIQSTTPAALVFAVVYYVAKSIQDIGQSSFEARVETAKAQVSVLLDTLVRVTITALFAGILAATVSGIGPLAGIADLDTPIIRWVHDNPGAALALATAAGGVVAAAAAIALLVRTRERGRFRMELLRDYWAFALPIFLTNTAGIIATNIDGTVLGLFLEDVDAGIFGAIRRIPLVLLGVGSAVAVILFPSISAMAARGDREGVQRTMDNALRYLSMLLLPIVAFILLFAEEIIRLAIGERFVPGASALRVLSAYVIVATFASAHGTLLLGLGQPKAAARIGLLFAVLVVVLDLILIPYDIRSLGLRLGGLGVVGAAIGTLVAGLVYYVGLRYANVKYAGYHETAHVWRHLAAALLMAALLFALDAVMPFGRWFHVPIYMLTGGLVYLGALFALRAITKEDIRTIQDTIHPGEMLRYVRTELFHRKR